MQALNTNKCLQKSSAGRPVGLNERQQRFLEAFRQRGVISQAARLALVHRATVYRSLADPAFASAVRTACEAFFQERRAWILADQAARQRWRVERELARRPMRCYYLARARAAKRRPGANRHSIRPAPVQ